MKFAIAFAGVLAVASAQFAFSTTPRPYRPIYPSPQSFPPRPIYPSPLPPQPLLPSPIPPQPLVNRVPGSEALANTVRYSNDIGPDGSYQYAYETDNSIAAQAQGTPKAFGGNPPLVPVVSQGSFAWTSPEGKPIAITYVADENGYQPQGEAIPTPHPIPQAILRSLEYIARNPQTQQK